ncbi:SDR family NAD(P)-dependent oxidoreductase [Streptomyces sp. HNM0575]|uniref:type I polyketide synthase n=1 Tax=Streptomyces sp. HNM0575 TaxID=2716338 RepID=UPI00145EF948|nr:type I polyketide synthase [Streptomyces sp. HNM0575]NLU76575.1 SDR family NAD(P)-dependent oxidoreductase [Streptomyces sp. HNM0575]
MSDPKPDESSLDEAIPHAAKPDEGKLVDYFKRVTADLYQTRQRLREVEQRDSEPIAIVGMACRLPGGADSPEEFWQLLLDGRDAVSRFPEDRGWPGEDELYHPDREHTGTSYVREGGFLHDADRFDPAFFGISPKEAVAMDPQQRLLLETAWEAFERAGIDPGTLRGSRTGVFAGVTHNDYVSRLREVPDGFEGQLLAGGAASIAAGRVSYTFGFEGPALALDTACSSSLVALHLAAQSLRKGESTLALAGGVTVMATPTTFVEFSRQGGLAGDARVKPFDAAADGTSMSEGAGWVLLERLSSARRNGHPVLAVLRGSAVNSDGASNGLTAPSGPSQQRVIRQALAEAGLTPAEVDVVEAHGTGTELGDPIEAQALIGAYGRERERPLYLGSVKSNIGHGQAAAGVASVIKTVLALRHGELPKTLWLREPTPQVDWSAGAVELLTQARPWPETGRPRRAGVSAFGASGTNAHAVLEQAPAVEEEPEPAAARPEAVPLVLSAKSPKALRAQAARLLERLDADPAPALVDVAYTLGAARASFEHRAVVVARDLEEARTGLKALSAGEQALGVTVGRAADRGRPVFVFPGQGPQWAGMAADLLATSAVFADEFRACAEALLEWVDWSPEAVLSGAAELDRVDVVQPLLWAVDVALAALWRSYGVEPSGVIGHSQGEIAAATAAGALSRRDGAKIVALRSIAVGAIAGTGGMTSVQSDSAGLAGLIEAHAGKLSVAAVNGPRATVVSGELGALDELEAELTAAGIGHRRIPVDYAAHSPQVERIRRELEQGVASTEPAATSVAFFSTVDGARRDGESLDAAYWYRNMRDPVLFEQAVREALDWGSRAVVEVSPHPVLSMAVQDVLDETDGQAVTFGTLRRGESGPVRFLMSLAEAYVHGVGVDWAAVFTGYGARLVDLPTYAFQRERFWMDDPFRGGDASAMGLATGTHPLAPAQLTLADSGELLLTGRISAATHPWLADHTVFGSVVVPGTALLDLALHAGAQAGAGRIDELVLQAPLVLPEKGGVSLQAAVGPPDDEDRRPFTVHTSPEGADGEWTCHATGVLGPEPPAPPSAQGQQWPPAGAEPLPLDGFYERMAAVGYGYGPAFQGLRSAWRQGDDLYAEVAVAGTDPGFALDPALLDAALHAVVLSGLDDLEQGGAARLPFNWNGAQVFATGATTLRVKLAAGDDAVAVTAFDADGALVFAADSLASREVSAEQVAAAAQLGGDRSLFRPEWTPLPVTAVRAGSGRWVAVGDSPAVRALTASDTAVRPFVHWESLEEFVAEGSTAPDIVVLPLDARGGTADEDVPAGVRRLTADVLLHLQRWLADERFAGSRMVVFTKNAMAVADGERPDPVSASVWGLLRSAQSENPGRLLAVDTDATQSTLDALTSVVEAATAAGEPQVVVRGGQASVARLGRIGTGERLTVPGEGPWRLGARTAGTIEGLALEPAPAATADLAAGEVRVGMRAAGVNFRDVLMTLGMYPGEPRLGSEGAGVVVEVGPGVTEFAPGDRVFGAFGDAFGPLAVADRRTLAPMPDDWTFAQAAAVPVAFLTALHGLRDLGGLSAGESVLIHAAAGGVGAAAVQIAQHLGAEVYATASPAKWDFVRSLGVDDGHLASSRTTEFGDKFSGGVDVVLNSLAGEYTDRSLEVLRDGGRFVEMGLTDLRDPADHPGIAYRPFQLPEIGADRVRELLQELLGLFRSGALKLPPIRTWDVRRAPTAFRFMSQARHIGKVVLTMPRPLDPGGTALVTGAAGLLGGAAARHLAARGVRNLLLLSRRPAPEELVAELEEAGAAVTVAACDVADRAALAAALDRVPAAHPLTAVVHTAGVLEDGVIASLTPERLDAVLRPKVDGLLNLDELTADADLAVFAAYSSAAGILGTAGQAGYNAGNTFTDALAELRRADDRPAVSLAWGPWAPVSEMTGNMGTADRSRMTRGGITPFDLDEGMRCFDASLDADEPVTVPITLDPSAARDPDGTTPALLRNLVRGSGRRRAAGSGRGESADGGASALLARLAGLDEQGRLTALADLVRREVALVLGHSSVSDIEVEDTFRELGFDSLSAVELRNRVNAATGVRMRVTTVFDYPTANELAHFLLSELVIPENGEAAASAPVSAPVETGTDTVVSLYLGAVEEGRAADAMAMLTAAAGLRRRFTGGEPAGAPKITTVASGDLRPALVCVAPPIAPMVETAYGMFAESLPEKRDVAVLRPTGFAEDELLPADLETMFQVFGEAVLAHAGLDPVVLVGHSSGGWITHGTATYLAGIGRPPAAAVLLDTYWPGKVFLQAQREFMRAQAKRHELMADDSAPLGHQLVAMGGYLGQFDAWAPEPAQAPTLLVRAAQYMDDEPKPAEVLEETDPGGTFHETVAVSGNHFSMMSKYPESTAAAVHHWLEKTL